jgi:hypothetical protein
VPAGKTHAVTLITDNINTPGVNLTVLIPMDKNGFLASCKSYSPKDWAQIVFMIIICLAGGYLIIYSVYMMTVNNNPSLFMFSLAMFGVGCTAIWFGLSHVEIQSTEEKLESITNRLDKIIEKMEKR